MKTNRRKTALILFSLTCLVLLQGCGTVPNERDTLPVSTVPAKSSAYNYAYWSTTTAYNMLAWIAPSKADWAKKVDILTKDALPYLEKARKGEITIEAALNLISAALPSQAHWTSLVQEWTGLIVSKGSDAFYGIADATSEYLAGDPLK